VLYHWKQTWPEPPCSTNGSPQSSQRPLATQMISRNKVQPSTNYDQAQSAAGDPNQLYGAEGVASPELASADRPSEVSGHLGRAACSTGLYRDCALLACHKATTSIGLLSREPHSKTECM
jgi:hypothetical protein